jgi:hypothetical protein
MNRWTIISEVTITGRIKTWMKYMRVTVPPLREVPPNITVDIHFPINGEAFAILIPMVAAPNAKLSHGRRYPE